MSFTVVIVVVVAVDPVIDVGHGVEDRECHPSEPEIFLKYFQLICEIFSTYISGTSWDSFAPAAG